MAASMLWLIVLATLAASSSAFEVTETIYTATDPARSGHKVTATLYLAKDFTSPAPVVAFAHGFGIGPKAYPLARMLTEQRGFVVLLPHNLGVVPSTVNLALDQVFLLAHAVSESSNPSSPLYKRVSNHTVLAGHSLGGGSTILAADRQLAAAYPTPSALFTVSLGTYTIPGALKSAPHIPATMPALLMSATEDCIDPPTKNSMPVFQDMTSDCAFVVSVVGGSHCQYASQQIGCTITEKLCGAHPNITRETQWQVALSVVLPFLDAVFDGKAKAPWAKFGAALEGAVSSNNVSVLGHRSDTCSVSTKPATHMPVGVDLLDSDFATACQREVGHASKHNFSITLLQADEKTFLTTKPSLQTDSGRTSINVTMLMHHEETAPFNHSLAIKMKSGQAITPGAAADDVTCASLHNVSLAAALAALDPAERQAYGRQTKILRFGSDKIWHTGLWVALARLQVQEGQHELTIMAPRFFASTKVPGKWGGVVYCRLVPPSAIRDWIRGQLTRDSKLSTVFV